MHQKAKTHKKKQTKQHGVALVFFFRRHSGANQYFFYYYIPLTNNEQHSLVCACVCLCEHERKIELKKKVTREEPTVCCASGDPLPSPPNWRIELVDTPKAVAVAAVRSSVK
jgi:hypothetical protein